LDGKGEPFLIDYYLSSADDIRGFPFGCGGEVQIFVEPLPSGQAMHAIEWFASLDQPAALLTVVSSEGDITPGARYGMNASCDSTYHGKRKFKGMENVAMQVLAERKSRFIEVSIFGKAVSIFAEYFEPPASVYVFGDGADARILQSCGNMYGMNVVRVSKSELRGSTPLAKMYHRLGDSFSVVMTHDLNLDTMLVSQLLALDPPYLGIMGPRSRTEKIFHSFDESKRMAICNPNIFAPVGLDLGAETPSEIALSILSEIQTVMRGRSPRHLRDVSTAIHERPANEVRTRVLDACNQEKQAIGIAAVD